MPDFSIQSIVSVPGGAISNTSPCCPASDALAGFALALSAGGTWPAINLALYFPFFLDVPVTAYRMSWFNGAAVSGNVDAGIYDVYGNKLVSTGSTAQAGTTAIQSVDITDTALVPGDYFLAMSVDNTTSTVFRSAGVPAAVLRCYGVQQQSVFPLPTTATFANPANAYYPGFSMALAATV